MLQLFQYCLINIEKPNKCYKYVDAIQRTVNSTISRSTSKILFDLLIGGKFRNREENFFEILEEEQINPVVDHLKTIRVEVKK